MEIRENIKVILGIEDTRQDRVLDILIKNVESHLKALLKKEEIPSKLDFIVEEITLRRFNRIGSEGLKSESVEGHSISFYDLKKEFDPYLEIIYEYADGGDKGSRGEVLFF